MDGFGPIEQSKYLANVTRPRSGPDDVDPEACDRISDQDTVFKYISNKLFNTHHEAMECNALYKAGSKWDALDKCDIPLSGKSLSMVFEAPSTILLELGVQRPERSRPSVTDLRMESTVS